MNELKRCKIYFAKHVDNIIGKPDIVFRRKRLVVFIDSDFWHYNPKIFIMPKTNIFFLSYLHEVYTQCVFRYTWTGKRNIWTLCRKKEAHCLCKFLIKRERLSKTFFHKSEHFKVLFPRSFPHGLTWDIIGVGVMDNTVENFIGLRPGGKQIMSRRYRESVLNWHLWPVYNAI